jgi:hypothetical protein
MLSSGCNYYTFCSRAYEAVVQQRTTKSQGSSLWHIAEANALALRYKVNGLPSTKTTQKTQSVISSNAALTEYNARHMFDDFARTGLCWK